MTRIQDPGFDSRIAEWLEDDPDTAPSVVLETLRGALPSIPQRRIWRSAWRFTPMPRFAFVAMVAGLIVIATIAIVMRPALGPGNPTAPPSQPASPGNVATPSASAPVSPAPTPSYQSLSVPDLNQVLPAGNYRLADGFAVDFGLTLPAEWSLKSLEHGLAEFVAASAAPGAFNSMSLLIVDEVYPDPCQTEAGPVWIGTKVENLVEALTSMTGFQAGPISDVSIGGMAGKSFTLTNSIDTNTANCTGGPMLWIATYDQFGEQVDVGTNARLIERIWVLDVRGKRILIDVASGDNSAANLAGAEALVSTIVFPQPIFVAREYDGTLLTETYTSATNHVSFRYPSGWRLTAGKGTPTSYQATGLERYDAVAVENARFIVGATPLTGIAGCCPIEWLSSFKAQSSPTACTAGDAITIGGAIGSITEAGCSSLGPFNSWTLAIAAVPHYGYVFQLDGDLDTRSWLEAFLETVSFPPE